MPKELPQPTEKQYEEFAQHVCWAHSWYKHIPLLQGAEFVFFFSQEAGQGFSKEKPRLHHTWKTTEEYRSRFGYLDYMWRFSNSQTFRRDSLACPFLPSESLLSSCYIVLYPYCSNDFNAPSVLEYLIAEEGWNESLTTSNHPRYQEVLQWFETYQLQTQIWQELSDSERDIAVSLTSPWNDKQIDANKLTEFPKRVAIYVQLKAKATNLYEALQESEMEKVRLALVRLRQLSEAGVQVWC